MSTKKDDKKRITIKQFTKVEGNGRLVIEMDGDKIEDLRLEIFESPRFFEALVKGRTFDEVPEMTSRICGICNQAHLLCAIKAVENAMDIKVSRQTETLREIMFLGSIIVSHALHLYLLALPDYFGFDNAIDMAQKKRKDIERGLKLKRLGNNLTKLIGGREIHAVRCVMGGFSKLPEDEEIKDMIKQLKESKDDAMKTADIFGKLKYPKFERESEYVALKKQGDFALYEGNIGSDKKLNLPQKNYAKKFEEFIKPYSTSKFVQKDKKAFTVGAIARLNVNRAALSLNARKAINKTKHKFPNDNPYINNLAQAVEIIHIIDKCLVLLESLNIKDEKPVDYKVKAGQGICVLEAPRGILIHDYTINAKGIITKANIVPPTTFNVHRMEEDIKLMIPNLLQKKEKEMIEEIEMLIRAYDPCISCSSHFLELDLKKK